MRERAGEKERERADTERRENARKRARELERASPKKNCFIGIFILACTMHCRLNPIKYRNLRENDASASVATFLECRLCAYCAWRCVRRLVWYGKGIFGELNHLRRSRLSIYRIACILLSLLNLGWPWHELSQRENSCCLGRGRRCRRVQLAPSKPLKTRLDRRQGTDLIAARACNYHPPTTAGFHAFTC